MHRPSIANLEAWTLYVLLRNRTDLPIDFSSGSPLAFGSACSTPGGTARQPDRRGPFALFAHARSWQGNGCGSYVGIKLRSADVFIQAFAYMSENLEYRVESDGPLQETSQA